MPETAENKERLQSLHLALEAALEQLGHAHEVAARSGELGSPTPDVEAIERLYGELTQVRNGVRDRLMKLLARPTLNIIK